MQLSVIIPTHDTRDLTLRCLECLESALVRPEEANTVASDVRVLVVDDASADGSSEAIAQHHPDVTLLRNEEPRGFSGSVQRAIDHIGLGGSSENDLVLLLNSDTEVASDAVWALVECFQQPDLAIVGASLHYPDGRAQWSGGKEPSLIWLFAQATGLPERWSRGSGFYRLVRARARSSSASAGSATNPTIPVSWVPGAALMVRSSVLEQLGGLDQSYRFYAQDLDLCTRARRAGWQVAIARRARVLHHLGASGAPPSAGPQQDANARRLALLWLDLLLWCHKIRGPRFGTWARRAISSGARIGALVDTAGRTKEGGLRRRALRHAHADFLAAGQKTEKSDKGTKVNQE